MTLIAISATRNSPGRSGLMKRLATFRDHISSRKETDRPCWPRMQDVPEEDRAPISVPPVAGGCAAAAAGARSA